MGWVIYNFCSPNSVIFGDIFASFEVNSNSSKKDFCLNSEFSVLQK